MKLQIGKFATETRKGTELQKTTKPTLERVRASLCSICEVVGMIFCK